MPSPGASDCERFGSVALIADKDDRAFTFEKHPGKRFVAVSPKTMLADRVDQYFKKAYCRYTSGHLLAG